MHSTPPDPPWRDSRTLLLGPLLVILLFGGLVTQLSLRWIQPVVGITLGLGNLIAFLLTLARSREPGPEQRGWRLMALSLFGVIIANAVLAMTPAALTRVSPAEALFFGLQLLLSVGQTAAMLSWPFRSPARTSHLLMNLLGSMLFGCSLFLVIWVVTLGQVLGDGEWPIFFRMLGLSIRISFVGGVAAYILAADPRRVRGPMGWIFAAAAGFTAILVLARPYIYDSQGVLQPTPLLGLVLAIPLAFIAAAWLRLPVEVAEDQPRLRFPWIEGLLYLPFIAVGGLVIHTALRHRDRFLTPLLGFMAVSLLLLLRQFLLLREVRRANERLEERVLARTQSLEELQGIMLRTERMNSVGALGAGLAHDLNNALGVITSSTELCKLDMEEGQMPAAIDLDRIMVAARQSSVLTSRLMAFARQEEEVLGPLDLAEEVANMEHVLRMMLPRQISLRMDLEHQACPIRGSRTRIEQILVNLVGNARDALPSGGTIHVRLRMEPPSAHLDVIDDGEGMTQETQARLFQPFFTTKPPGKGTGLGLASVRMLVEESAGTIQVASERGRGTHFKLTFPVLV